MKRIILAVAAAISCNAAFAAEPGAYVTASVGVAEQKLSVEGLSLSDDDTGAQIAAGLRITPNFGVEAGYTTFGKVSVGDEDVSVTSKPTAFYGAVTGSFDISPEFAITGKLGIARDRTKIELREGSYSESVSERETSVVFGVGASYDLTPEVALIAEYQNFGKILKGDGGSLKASIISVGVRYSF